MAYLDEKTTQAISRFTIDDVAIVAEKETLKIADADREMRIAQAKLASDTDEPKEVIEQEVQNNVNKINDTFGVLIKIGSYSKEFNGVILKSFATLVKSEDELSPKTIEAIKKVSETLIRIRGSLDSEEDVKTEADDEDADNEYILDQSFTAPAAAPAEEAETAVETPVAEQETQTEEVAEEEPVDPPTELELLRADNEKFRNRIVALHERLKSLERKSKLFMYCGLGVCVITVLSLIFSIVAMAK